MLGGASILYTYKTSRSTEGTLRKLLAVSLSLPDTLTRRLSALQDSTSSPLLIPRVAKVAQALWRGDATTFLRMAQSYRNSYPTDRDIYFLLATFEYRRGEYGDAVALYDTVIALSDTTAVFDSILGLAFVNRGVARRGLGQDRVAFNDYVLAARYFPTSPLVYYDLANTAIDLSRLKEADSFATLALKYDTSYAQAYNLRGDIRYDLGELEKSIADYTSAIQQNPNEADYYFNRSVPMLNSGIIEDAEKDLLKALELDPTHPKAHANLGLLLARTGRVKEAISEYQAAIDAPGNLPEGAIEDLKRRVTRLQAALRQP